MGFSKYDRRVVRVLDHVQVMMPEGGEDDARRFYAGILGLTEVEKPEPMRANGGVWFAEGIHVSGEGGFSPPPPGTPGAARRRHRLAWPRRSPPPAATSSWDERWPGVRRFYTRGPVREPRGGTVRQGSQGRESEAACLIPRGSDPAYTGLHAFGADHPHRDADDVVQPLVS